MIAIWNWLIENPEAAAAIAAFAGIALSVLALAVTLWQLRIQRVYQRLSLRPKLERATELLVPGDGLVDASLVISLMNTGLGPCEIKSFELVIDGKSFESFYEWLGGAGLIPDRSIFANQLSNKPAGVFMASRFRQGKILPANGRLSLISYDQHTVDFNSLSREAVEQVLLGFCRCIRRTSLRVVYSDLFGKEFVLEPDGSDWLLFPEPIESLVIRPSSTGV